MKSPVVLLSSLLADVKRLEPDVDGLDRDIITIEKRYKDEGSGFLTCALPAFCDALDRGLASGRFACPTGLKKTRGGAIPRLFQGMLCKVFDTITGNLLETPSLGVVKLLREVLRLFKKLELEPKRDEDLDFKAKLSFFKTDLLCASSSTFDSREEFILGRVSQYILPNIESFDERELVCKHGPGSVYEGLKPNQKWQALLTYSSKLDELGYDIFYHSSCDNIEIDSTIDSTYGPSGDVARLVTVPKSSTSKRTITVEPVVRQFVQQGYNALLRSEIELCDVLKHCLALSDQEPNQKLALEGSLTGEWATLDLKSASDSLSLRIVESVFRHRPRFLAGILGCRSAVVYDGLTPYTLQKFAGMGNATTFPVQSVVFAVLAICALLEGVVPSYKNVQRVARSVRVFGDDIIVPTKQVRQVVDWITKAGLVVNHGKSFTEGNFRESCGVDAFRGVDVTPLYCRAAPVRTSFSDPSTLAKLVAFGNHSWLRGLYTLSTCIRDFVDSGLRRPLPLVSQNSGILGWHSHTDLQTVERWNGKLHRFEVKGPVAVAVKRSDRLDGYAALLKYFHAPKSEFRKLFPEPDDGFEADHLSKTPVRFRQKIATRWVPVY